MQYRVHECWRCELTLEKEVELSESTPNLSGEKSTYCPKCGKKTDAASEVRERGPCMKHGRLDCVECCPELDGAEPQEEL